MRIISEIKRKCGLRKEGGVYMVSGEERSEFGTLPVFTLINPPIPYNVRVHRGARLVDEYKVFERAPMDEWWVGSSKKTEEKKDADQWAIDTFGMTIHARINIGDCAGAKDADTAMQILEDTVMLRVSAIKFVRLLQALTFSKVQELPRAATYFDSLQKCVQAFAEAQDQRSLVAIGAAVWRLAHIIAPKKRSEYIPHLQRLLVAINLVNDAASMKTVLGE